jgi:hypothetical protein
LDCLGLQEGHTLEQFLKSLEDKFCELSTGEDGDDGDSAYQIWLNLGNVGTEQDFEKTEMMETVLTKYG